jgi:hypothetical protein
LDLTATVTADDLMRYRANFLTELRQLVYTIRKDNKPVRAQFSEHECVDIANFFFYEVMGPSSLGRLTHLVQYYMQVNTETGLDRGVGTRAKELSKDHLSPPSLRRFFRAFGKTVTGETSSQTTLSSLYRMANAIKLAKFYTALTTEIRQSDGRLKSWLIAHNYRPRKGTIWTAVVIRYVSDALSTPAAVWKGTCQTAIGVRSLQKEFGNGVLTLLPISTMNK